MIIETPLEAKLLDIFYWFHAHPELSYEEFETTKKIKEFLTKHQIEVLDLPLQTGLVAMITGELPGKTIALRCDIDALPIQEKTELSYCSIYPNKMHACGHDFHTTALLGAALLLKEAQKQLKGTIKLIFQPAEESSLGALKIIETGILKDVSSIFGIHVSSSFPVGTVGITGGSISAAVDRFALTIKGKGTHAGYPHKGIDPIPAAASFVSSTQNIISRNLSPFDTGLISITKIQGGSTWNVIPEEVFLEGTVRTLDRKIRKQIEKTLQETAEYTSRIFETKSDFKWIAGPPAVNNDQKWSAICKEVAMQQGLKVDTPKPSMGGEDFSFYLEDIPGTFIQIGTGDSYPNHHPKFSVDPKAILLAANYCASLATKALEIWMEEEGKSND